MQSLSSKACSTKCRVGHRLGQLLFQAFTLRLCDTASYFTTIINASACSLIHRAYPCIKGIVESSFTRPHVSFFLRLNTKEGIVNVGLH